MRSVRLLGVAVLAAATLGGCVSTQTKNARTLLVNQRTLDSQASLKVARANPHVAVTAVALVRSGHATAVVVRLRNLTGHPLSDLPIEVGVRDRGGRKRYLNRGANLPYFDTHVASLARRAATIWVLMTGPAVASGARPFARVGFATLPATTTDSRLPRIVVAARPGNGRLRIGVVNESGVPQYDLQVYAAAIRRGRYVAAGRASLPALDGGGRARVGLALLGAPAGGQVLVFAPATIFN